MGFHEVQFPTDISHGSRGGPGFAVDVIQLDSGAERRVSRWAGARRSYDIRYGVRKDEDLMAVQVFFLAREGATHGWRYKDWVDFTTATDGFSAHTDTDAQLGTGDASTVTSQLRKGYVSGSTTVWRNIEKPVASTVLASLDDVTKTEGVDYSVDTTTGVITWNTAPGAGVVIKAGCEFDVPVRFGESVSQGLSSTIVGYQLGDMPAIDAVELVSELAVPDDYNYGNATYLSTGIDFQLSASTARFWRLDVTAASKKAFLPDNAGLALGGPYFALYNDGSNSFSVRTQDDTAVVTVAAGETAEVWLGTDASENRIWEGWVC